MRNTFKVLFYVNDSKDAYICTMKKVFLIWVVLTWVAAANVCGQDTFYRQLADSAYLLTRDFVIYDPAYFRVPYPGVTFRATRASVRMLLSAPTGSWGLTFKKRCM